MSRLGTGLIVFGALLVVLGLALHFGPSLSWVGRLPGDLRIERPGFRLYLPLASCLLLSGVVSILWWLFTRFR